MVEWECGTDSEGFQSSLICNWLWRYRASPTSSMSIDLTLDRIRALASHLQKPYTRPTCHIAGTNGKGSVTAILSTILRCSTPPLSVGRFNSPHLVSIYDCIFINNEPVAPDVYAKARSTVQTADMIHSVGVSSFELLTLTALLVFEEAEVDIVVIEVGMGGRLDATNIISDECILASALTAVDLDHQAFLGNTVESIAREKAAIARSGKPFVIGKQKHHAVIKIVQGMVEDDMLIFAQAAVKREWDESLDGPKPEQFSFAISDLQANLSQPVEINPLPPFSKPIFATLPLYGEHQLENLGIAVSMVSALLTHSCTGRLSPSIHARITPETIVRGIQSTKWPGRLSLHTIVLPRSSSNHAARSLTVLADGAHNPASSTTLGNFIEQLLDLSATRSQTSIAPISLTYILALSQSPPKQPHDTLSPLLLPAVHHQRVKMNVALVRFTPPDGMPWVKSVSPSELRRAVLEVAPGASTWASDDDKPIEKQLSDALVWAGTHQQDTGKNGDGLVVLAGSLYLVADLYRFMKLP